MSFYRLLKWPVGTSVFCEPELCPSRADPRRHPKPSALQTQLSSGCFPFIFSLWALRWEPILCCLLPVFSLGFSIRVSWFPVLCHAPIPVFACIFIFLLVALQSPLTAVINGFDICLNSSPPIFWALKYSPSKSLSVPSALVDAWLQNRHCSVELPSFLHIIGNNQGGVQNNGISVPFCTLRWDW